MIVIYIIGGLIATIALISLILKIVFDFPLRKSEPGFKYVLVDIDGSVRDLYNDEIEYINTEFIPSDSGRPNIKTSYNNITKVAYFIRRRRVPKHIAIRPVEQAEPDYLHKR
jgi:hypothetical protein